MNDIATKEDIVVLVDKFYDKVKTDPVLGPVFSHVDWPSHLPTMYRFWASLLLGEQSYRGNPLQKHSVLPLEKIHFDRWLALFTTTVDSNFEGSNAQEIKSRACHIAQIFQLKMGMRTP